MKISKVFGVVLSLHAGVAILLVQPGCQTTQGPSSPYIKSNPYAGDVDVATSSRPSSSAEISKPYTDPAISDDRSIRTIPTTNTSRFIPAVREGGVPQAPSVESSGRSVPTRPSSEAVDAFNSDIPSLQPVKPEVSIPEVKAPEVDPVPQVDFAGTSSEEYTVQKGDSLWAIAKKFSVSINDLYEANGLNKNSVLSIGQLIKIPVEGGSAAVTTVKPDDYQPTSFDVETKTHKVAAGDSLSKLSRKYRTSIRAIKAANNKSSDIIRIGETLVIPVGEKDVAGSSSQPTSRALLTSIGSDGTHKVRAGEIPGVIARKYGMTTAELMALNNIDDPRTLQVGQVLKVRKRSDLTPEAQPGVVAPKPSAPRTDNFAPAPSSGPVVIEPVKTVDSSTAESGDVDVDALFDSAVEIPVIRLEE